MSMERTSVSVDKEAVAKAKPYLRKDGYTVSSFIRKALWDYIAMKQREDRPLNIDSIEGIR